jgi:nucleoside-diphosphate-sugar epimerase
MRVLLTGATGFLGRHTLAAFSNAGIEVAAVYHTKPGAALEGVRWIQADLTEGDDAARIVHEARATHLVQLAWRAVYGDIASSRENLDWLQASLLLARQFIDAGGRRIVGCGSCFEYAWDFGICREDFTPLAPATLYGATKHALHLAMDSLAKQSGVTLGWGRAFFLYGPHEHPTRLVTAVISALLDGRLAETSHGRQIRDYLYVRDAAEGIVALTHSDAGGAFNIAAGNVVSLGEIISEIAGQIGRPDLIRLGARSAQPFEPPIIVGHTAKSRDILGFEAKTDLKSGIAATITAMRSQRASAAPAFSNSNRLQLRTTSVMSGYEYS